ncbi:hypothetical protein [Duganella violaceipulchra]|uniref:DNA-binding protein n=2 Tax=Duganella violaceipulchra TaxID=2849652 RepID=A0ABT1GJA3_9BURK|nr:hypothetical protein [Duganella violaceicalia]MCP2008606.1 hypothetical protein [Duganella violaceicalia]
MARIAKKAVAESAMSEASDLIDITVGSITIRAKKPTAQQMVRARGEGKRAAIALAGVLAEPGVELIFEPGTPIFSVDPQDPNLVIRELDGRTARGYFKNGKFVEVP